MAPRCAPGMSGAKTGQRFCASCGAGKTSTAYGQATCKACPLGRAGTDGLCGPCPPGQAPNAQATACAACTDGKVSPAGRPCAVLGPPIHDSTGGAARITSEHF